MPRPKRASDEQVLAATSRVVARLGPHRMTLADVAAEVGITPAAIVQRFGSKRDLLLASIDATGEGFGDGFRAARAGADSPLDALVTALAGQVCMFETPEQVAASLSFLQLDLTDPAFRARTARFFEAYHRHVRALLEEATAQGELAGGRVDALARMVEVTYHGSLLAWALRREGRVEDAMRRDLEALLAPHRLKGGTTKAPRRSRGGTPAGAAPPGRRGRAPSP